MRVPWLPDVLADAGLNPRVLAGARGRGRAMATVYGVVVHDTVTPSRSWTNARVDALLRDGHSNLAGPLSQLGVDFNARPVVIADGRCNHNGFGTWGNDSIGIEVYCGGGLGPEPWTPAQRETVLRMSRAILAHLQLGPSGFWNPRLAGHKETDPRRKQDPHGVSVPALRTDVARTGTSPAGPKEFTVRDADKEVIRDLIREHVPAAVWSRPLSNYDGVRADMALGRAAAHSVSGSKALASLLDRPAGEVDPAAVADAVLGELGPELAAALADELASRLSG